MIELDRSLLNAKFSVPQARPGTVSQADLIDGLRGAGSRVVGVTAPAGYGKSTLLAEWARREDRPVAWVSLDRYDDDPAVLLALLAAAYTGISPSEQDLVASMGGPGTSVLGRAAPRLAAAFNASPQPFVMMLDDLHSLTSPVCHDVFSVAIGGVPPGSQLVASSRFAQPHLPRLRAAGDAIEVGADELALDESGAIQIFAEAQLTLSPQQAPELITRTEGWPAGLYLAAVIARNAKGESLISGADRFVADYLYRESLVHLPKKTQRFLRRTAVLDQMCAPLCDALLGESDGQERLVSLETSNSFLVPLDRQRDWYRYHGLFREFLLGELRRLEPDSVMKLHLRAADWYEANGSPVLALEHLLNTDEQDRCVQLTTSLLVPTYQLGQVSTVERWLATLGPGAIQSYPPLAVLAGWVAALTGKATEAQRWAAILEDLSFDDVPVDGSASFASARAMLRAIMCPRGPEQMLADTELAVSQEPNWSLWRDHAMGLHGMALKLGGDADQAVIALSEASTLAAKNGNADVVVICESELAVIAMDRGRWAAAADHVRMAIAAIEEHRMKDYATSVLAFAAAARVGMHTGDLADVDRQLTQAMRARPTLTIAMPFTAVRVRLQLAKVSRARGDQPTARHLLREIDDILLHRPDLGTLVEEVAAFRAALDTGADIGATGASPLSPAELRLLPYLQTHLTIAEIGERLFVTRNTASSEVASIYRKLGVSSRNDAVERATAVGLLGA